VKTSPWLVPWLAGGALAASALICAAQAQPPNTSPPVQAPDAQAPSLAEAVEAAWLRSAEAAQSRGQQRLARADQAVAGSWLSAAPALQLSQREGRGSAAGQRDTEVGIALPLWRLGARSAAGQAAQAELDWSSAAEAASRLHVAGQVREAAYGLRRLEAELRLATTQLDLMRQLAQDVDRRVQAGDLAPADAMAAQAEWLASQAQQGDARQQLQAQLAQWHLLTGWTRLAVPQAEGTLDAFVLNDAHPELRLAAHAVERAQRKLALAQMQRGSSPELGISLRQERPGSGNPALNSVGVALRLPFGGETHPQPRIASALAEVDVALSQQQLLRDRLVAELELARSQVGLSESQARLEGQRAKLLRERARHIDKAFKAGETGLPELLRALSLAAQAEIASERQQAALQLARARLQQSQGLLP